MVDINLNLAIFLGRFMQKTLCFLPFSGGQTAPGLLALKIDPKFIKKQSNAFKNHIIVSGTNGKTTTARMVSSILIKHQIPYIHNRSGSNLLRGIASAMLKIKYNQPKKPIGLWEVDEAVLPYAIKELEPKAIVLTNLFRDQLDRYGEIDALAKKWLKALQSTSKNTKIILNADDAALINIGRQLKTPAFFFGINDKKIKNKAPAHAADATFCPKCLKPLKYQQVFYSHLGNFSCSCGFCQPAKNIQACAILRSSNNLQVVVKTKNKKTIVKAPISGLFNVYNLLAALSVSSALKLDFKTSASALASFRPAFGRMERIKAKNKTIDLMLCKNPTGFNQIISALQTKQPLPLIVIAINDKLADGTDVSWLWDVNFEKMKNKAAQVIITGTRAWDMALRLKYAGFEQNSFKLITTDFKKALGAAMKNAHKKICILPTYTAMLNIRRIFCRQGIVHSSWED